MSKNTTFFGQPIFSQLINLIPRSKVDRLVKEYKSDHYCKKLDTFQHLITILYGVVSGCNTLRKLITGIVSYGHKISHCKFDYTPRRSTVSDANKRRSYTVFEAIYNALVKQYLPDLSDSHHRLFIDKKVYAIDSTTIKLFQPIFNCVGRNPINGKRKGGIKSHQKLDLQTGIPVKVYHSHATEHDSLFIQHQDVVNPGEIVLFDKAYNNYKQFAKWNESEINFVTRLKNNAQERLIEEFELSPATPDNILRDAKIALSYKDENNQDKEVELRLVCFYHQEKNKVYYFLTNLFDLQPQQIADLYKKRWQIELLFKKIKQNFPLQYFYGDNQNAIQLQIWVSLIALLLISVMKRSLSKRWGFSNLISVLQKHLFSYVKFKDFFDHMDNYVKDYHKNKGTPEEIAQQLVFELS